MEREAPITHAREWADGRDDVAPLLGCRFPRSEPRQHARMDWRGVRSPVERQTGWQVEAPAGQETPDATQPLLGRAVWSAEEVRDARRADVVEPLGEADGVVVIDETGL